jgi:hypothetical protein
VLPSVSQTSAIQRAGHLHLSGSENRWKRKVYSVGRKPFLRQRGKLFHCGTAPVEISNLRSSRNLCFVWLFAFFIQSIHFSFSAKPFF